MFIKLFIILSFLGRPNPLPAKRPNDLPTFEPQTLPPNKPIYLPTHSNDREVKAPINNRENRGGEGGVEDGFTIPPLPPGYHESVPDGLDASVARDQPNRRTGKVSPSEVLLV